MSATMPVSLSTVSVASSASFQVTVARDELLLAVNSVQRASATRVIQPILANVLMEAELATGFLRLSATDLDFSLQTQLNAQIHQAGRSTLSAKKLAEILAKLPAKASVTLTVDETTQTCRIECGASQFELRTLSADEFPAMPNLGEDKPCLQVPLEGFLRAIRQTEFAAASFESNNILGGVFFKLSADTLEMVATDGSRLARRVETSANEQVSETMSAIIPARTLQEFLKLASAKQEGATEEVVRIALIEGQVYLATPRILAVSRLLDGQYPRYEQLIPVSNTLVASANKQALIASLERAAVMANERTNVVRLTLEPGQLTLAANTEDGNASKDVLPVRYEGEPMQMAFNYKYVLDALKVIEADEVRLETNGALAPTVFRADEDASYICLVMPVQVK